jgi:hypothetical protein
MRPGIEFLPVEDVKDFIENYGYGFSTMEVMHAGQTTPSGMLLASPEMPGENIVLAYNEKGEAPAYEARKWAERVSEAIFYLRSGEEGAPSA